MGGGATRVGALAWLWLLGACQASQGFSLERDDPNSILIVILPDARGWLADFVAYGPGVAADRPLSLDRQALGFGTLEIAPADLVRAGRGAVSPAELAGVQVRRVDDPELEDPAVGACERCADPTMRAPQLVAPGDRCLPLLSRARWYSEQSGVPTPRSGSGLTEQDLRLLSGFRKSLRLEWPGACAEPDPSARSWDFSPISPAEQPWPLEVYAQTVDGTVGVFGPHQAGWVALDRTRALVVDGDVPFRGPVLAAIATSSVGAPARYVVASRGPSGTEYHRFTATSSGMSVTPAEVTGGFDVDHFEPRQARYVAGHWLWVGAFAGEAPTPALVECLPTEAGLDCVAALIGQPLGCPGTDPVLLDFALTRRGVLAVSKDAFYFAPSLAEHETWSCALSPERSVGVEGPDGVSRRLELASVGGLGDWAFACGDLPTVARSVLLQSELDPALGPFGDTAPIWTDARVVDQARCGEVVPWPLAEGPTLRVDLGRGFAEREFGTSPRWKDLNSFGEAGALRQTPTGTQPLPVLRLMNRTPGWSIGTVGWFVEPTPRGAGVLVRPDSPSAWSPLWEVEPWEDLGPVVARAQDAIAFVAFTNLSPFRIVDRNGLAEVTRLEALRGSPFQGSATERISGTLWSRRDDAIYYYGNVWTDGSGDNDQSWRPFLRRIEADLERVSELPLPLSTGNFLCDAVELAEDQILLVGGNGALVELRNGQVRPVPIDFDDPETPEVEEAPRPYLETVPKADFLSVSAAGGVAWAVGRNGVIVRVHPRPGSEGATGELVAERVSLNRIGPEGLRRDLAINAYLSHVVAVAPNHVYVVAQRRPIYAGSRAGCAYPARDRYVAEQAQIFEIGENPALHDRILVGPDQLWQHQLVISSYFDQPDGSVPELIKDGFFSDGARPMAVEWSGGLRRADERLPLPFFPGGADRAPNGDLIVVGPNGRIAIGRAR